MGFVDGCWVCAFVVVDGCRVCGGGSVCSGWWWLVAGLVVVDQFLVVIVGDGTGMWLWVEGREKIERYR